MSSDTDALKPRLKEFLSRHGVEFNDNGKFRCPLHEGDDTPSMGLVPGSNGKEAHCFGCGASADIYAFAAHFYGLDARADFPEIKARVAGELGQVAYDAPAKTSREKPLDAPVTLTLEAARAVYTPGAITGLGKFIFGGDLAEGAELKLEAAWPCLNGAGEVEFVEARFAAACFLNGKKRPCAVWWNGKRLKSKGNPHGLFGRELLAKYPEKPALIVEGPKCQAAAKALDGFVPVAWNGGAHGQRRVDFSPLRGRRVYIWPDDDANGTGEKSARATAKLLQGIAKEIIIVRPLPEARAVKPDKADIVEALQVKTPEEVTRYILSHTPPAERPKSNDPYIGYGAFLAERGFFRVYDRKAIGFYSTAEEQPYHYSEIRDKFAEDKIVDRSLNPAKGAKMINNLDPAYPVYHLVKSFGYPPLYMGQNGQKKGYVINRWRGFQYPLAGAPTEDPGIEAEAEFVKAHIRDIICGGNEADYDYFCKWVAHLFQKPDIKPGVAIFAHSEVQGTGKSIIFEQLIPNMLGIDITRVFSNEEQISEKFNSWLFESLYIVFSEQSFYGNTENIKSWITDPNQSRRDMGTESRQERSFARFVICTNKESAFRFEESERRMFVLNVSSRIALEEGGVKWPYFNRLGEAVNSASVLNLMARFFCSISIEGFNPFDLPESEKKREIIEAEKHPVIDFFEAVAYGEEKKCQILPCAEIDPQSVDNYHKSEALYEALRSICKNGESFIERKRLFDVWRETVGRNRKETMNRFTRIIKTHYPVEKVEILGQVIWEGNKSKRTPVIIIKPAFFVKKELPSG